MGHTEEKQSAAESLRKTRTFGKVRCHNPSCMGRITPEPGAQRVRCPTCGMEYRLIWVNETLPHPRAGMGDEPQNCAASMGPPPGGRKGGQIKWR